MIFDRIIKLLIVPFLGILLWHPSLAWSSPEQAAPINLTAHWVGYCSLVIFVVAYIFVILEEKTHLRKSKPALLAAGFIWILIAVAYQSMDRPDDVEAAIRHNFLEYAELFFFLLVAMTYINAMLERNVFEALRAWLVMKGFTYRGLFWLTGIIAFFMSPLADNLTTALIMCAVILAVNDDKPSFVSIACINIVVAANAGGAFSPFGDITTLMVWQKGVIEFREFFSLFIPAVVNFVLPALIMQFKVPEGKPPVKHNELIQIKVGGITTVVLFLLTIATAVSFHNLLHLPPVYGMLLGLGYLKLYSFYLQRSATWSQDNEFPPKETEARPNKFDVFENIAQSEWDTLFFFYGVILAVGGLAYMGYLGMASTFFYGELGPTTANILVGISSAVVDNIPMMFAVLTMYPEMSHNQWLLVTLTAGVGGSLLSVGSAAGVALMGQARGQYTFFGHLKWTPIIAIGYAASIVAHLWINGT